MSSESEDRLQKLEELVAHQSIEIETLSDTVSKQWMRIDELTQAMMRFRDRLTEVEEAGNAPHEITKPPHY